MSMLAAIMLLAASLGCQDTPVEVLSLDRRVTFYEDVAPALARSCWCCHRGGGVAPSLVTAEEVRVHYDAVLASIEDGSMPPLPQGPEPIDGCETLRREAPRMSASETSTLVTWATDGYRPGDPTAAPALPDECWPLPDGGVIRIELPPQGLVEGDRVERKCFVTGIEAEPGRVVVRGRLVSAPSTFRSIIVWTDPSVHEAAPGELPCSPTYQPWTVEAIGGVWAGDDVMDVPQGMGVAIDGGVPLFATVIYDNGFAGGDFESTPVVFELDLLAETAVTRRLGIAHIRPDDIVLEPDGGAAAVAEGTLLLGRSAPDVFGVVMQMHDFGEAATAVLGPHEAPACVLSQREWRPSGVRPVLFDPALGGLSHARISCSYDLGERTEPVLDGPPPNGETCLLSLFVGLP